jgi:hypothetical protein
LEEEWILGVQKSEQLQFLQMRKTSTTSLG